MKTKSSKFLTLLLLILIILSCKTVLSQQNKIIVQFSSPDKQVIFAGNEIKKAAEYKGYNVTIAKSINSKANVGIIIKIISDPVSSEEIAQIGGLKVPEHVGWQCYSIRIKETGNQKIIYVGSADKVFFHTYNVNNQNYMLITLA